MNEYLYTIAARFNLHAIKKHIFLINQMIEYILTILKCQNMTRLLKLYEKILCTKDKENVIIDNFLSIQQYLF